MNLSFQANGHIHIAELNVKTLLPTIKSEPHLITSRAKATLASPRAMEIRKQSLVDGNLLL